MARKFDDLEKEIRALDSQQKATLAHILIQELDSSVDEDAEAIWIDEAKRRYQEFKEGKINAISGDEVMRQARHRLK